MRWILSQPRILGGFARVLLALFVVSAMLAPELGGLPAPRVAGFELARDSRSDGISGLALSSSSFVEELEEEFDEDDSPLSLAALCGCHEIEAALAAAAAWVPNLQRLFARLTTGPPLL